MLDVIEMNRSECERLLHSGVVGRVAFSTPTGPQIIPVNYSVLDGAILLRTSPYSLLGTHGRDAVLAFEVDRLDSAQQDGWSVFARGRAEVVTDAEDLERIRATSDPRPWASGSRHLVLRLPWTDLTGRRLGSACGS